MQYKFVVFPLLLSAAALTLAGCPLLTPATEIEGTWVGKTIVNGEPLFDDPTYSETFVFEGNKFQLIVRNPGQNPAIVSGTFTVNAEEDTIDINVENEPGGTHGLSPGVYKIEGTTLRTAFGGIGGQRPSRAVLDSAVGPVFVGELSSANKSVVNPQSGGGLF